MSIKTITAWVDGAVQSIEVDDKQYAVPTPVLPKITLLGGENYWNEYYDEQGTKIGYYQTVASIADGAVTTRSKVDLQPSPEQLAVFREKDITFTAINEDGVVTVYAVGVRPEQDYTIQCTITEVAING